MFSKAFWKAAAERAVKTFAQTSVVLYAGDAGFDVLHTNLEHGASLALGAALLSILMSVASAKVDGPGPSLGQETVDQA